MRRNFFEWLFLTVLIGLLPFVMGLLFDLIVGYRIDVKYLGVSGEIYFFNILIFSNDIKLVYSQAIKQKSLMLRLCIMLELFIFMILTITYIQYRMPYLYEFEDKYITVCTVITISATILNLVASLLIQIITHEGNKEDIFRSYLVNELGIRQYSKDEIIENETVNDEEVTRNKIQQEKETKSTDIIASMLNNYDETREYFQISKNQSKFSFYLSIVSSIVGLLVLMVSVYGIVAKENLEVSIIAAVSGAVTEVISGVVLWIHNKSALQLNYYYDALHENEKFLSAINMADKLCKEKKEEMYIEIIRKQIVFHEKDNSKNRE